MAVSINGNGTITGVSAIESVPASDVDFTPSGGLAATDLQKQVTFINKMVGTDGYAVPVAYASGIILTLTSQTVEYNGVIYAPLSSALPFTTSSWGTDSAKFRAVQVTDAAYLSYTPSGTGAVATTVESQLRYHDSLVVSVTDLKFSGGAKGDGTTDDTAAIDAAIQYVNSLGGGTVVFPPGTYVQKRPQVGSQRGIYVRSRVRLLGYGATLDMQDNASFFTVEPAAVEGRIITADVAVGDTALTVAATGSLAAGDTVFVRLNTAPYDMYEPANWYWAKIVSVVGTTVTLDRPAPAAMLVAATSEMNRTLVKVSDVSAVNVEGFNFTCSVAPITGQVEGCVNAKYVHGLKVLNCTASNCGAGLVIAQYCEGVQVENITANGIRAEVASKGRLASIAECDGVLFENIVVKNFEANAAIVVEASSINCTFNEIVIDVDGSTGTGNRRYAFSLLGQGPISVNGLTITGKNLFAATSSQSLGEPLLTDVNIISQFTVDGPAGGIVRDLMLNGVQYERRVITARVALPVNGSKEINLPSGRVLGCRLLASSVTGLTSVFLRRDGTFTNNGANLKPSTANLTYFTFVDLINLSSAARNYNDDKQLYIATDATMGAGNYLYMQLEMLVRVSITEDAGQSLMNHIEA